MAKIDWPAAEKRSLIGKRIDRADGPAKATGAAKYSYDIKIQDPTAYNGLTWTVDPFENFTFTIESQPIHSKTGYWHVRWTGPGGDTLEDTWQYHADYTFRGMCPDGTYVVTFDW